MRKSIALGIVLLASSTAGSQPAAVPVSVTRFNQEVDHVYEGCSSWVFTNQNQLQTELERELSLSGLKVLERRNIREIYSDEYEMPNLDQKTVAKRNQFVAAKFTITGAITDLGICENSSGNKVRLGGIVSLFGGPDVDLNVKNKSHLAKVKVVGHIVSVETGAIVKSFDASAELTESGYDVEGGVYGIGGSHNGRTRPPIERATNQAIHDLASKIASYLITTSCKDCEVAAR